MVLKAWDMERYVLVEKAANKDLEHKERKFWKGSFNWLLGKKMKKSFISQVSLGYATVKNHLKFSVAQPRKG